MPFITCVVGVFSNNTGESNFTAVVEALTPLLEFSPTTLAKASQ
jgi:hypothetical protein